jgi:hypothetical protein
VSEDQLEVLRLVSNGEAGSEHRETIDELTSAGLIVGGSIHPLVADLAAAMTQPLLELWVEAMGPQGPTLSHIVVRGDEDLWYTDPWPGERDEVVFVKDELPQLIWVVARLVGLRRSTPPQVARPVTAGLSTVASLMAALSAGGGADWDDVRTVTVARLDDLFGELSPEQREMWIAVVATLEGTWRVTCAWGPDSPDGAHARGLAVWDCGPGGYWLRTSPLEPLRAEDIGPGTEATFTPTSAGDLWKAFAGLLPSKAELTAAAEATAANRRS